MDKYSNDNYISDGLNNTDLMKNIRKYQRQRLGINQISFSQISDFKTAIRIHKEDQHSSVNSRHHPHTSAVKRIQNDLIIITNPKLMICYCKKQDHNH
mgnify:CR=1 FL=1